MKKIWIFLIIFTCAPTYISTVYFENNTTQQFDTLGSYAYSSGETYSTRAYFFIGAYYLRRPKPIISFSFRNSSKAYDEIIVHSAILTYGNKPYKVLTSPESSNLALEYPSDSAVSVRFEFKVPIDPDEDFPDKIKLEISGSLKDKESETYHDFQYSKTIRKRTTRYIIPNFLFQYFSLMR